MRNKDLRACPFPIPNSAFRTPHLIYHPTVAEALEHICRMRGGAQAHLMRCRYENPQGLGRNECYFVVKFQNNPQHVRVLANELLCTRLADHLGLPVPHAEQVLVSPELVAGTSELRVELPRGCEPCLPGWQFGSQFPGDPRTTPVFDFVPDQTLDRLANGVEFAGMLVFDQWTCNTNGRQVVFVREPQPAQGAGGRPPAPRAGSAGGAIQRERFSLAGAIQRERFSPAGRDAIQRERFSLAAAYRALMIDQGFCFNNGEWSFPDAPLRGLYLRQRVYAGITGWDSFEPWLTRVRELDLAVLARAAGELPVEWYGRDWDALDRLVETLYQRRRHVPELIEAVRRSSADVFPNWRS